MQLIFEIKDDDDNIIVKQGDAHNKDTMARLNRRPSTIHRTEIEQDLSSNETSSVSRKQKIISTSFEQLFNTRGELQCMLQNRIKHCKFRDREPTKTLNGLRDENMTRRREQLEETQAQIKKMLGQLGSSLHWWGSYL